jgi:hypothetical protein
MLPFFSKPYTLSIMTRFYRIAKWRIAFFLLLTTASAQAQTPVDGLMMGRRYLCNVLNYSNSQWSEYWEGSRLRVNENIGTFTNQNVMVMSAYGLSDDLNLIAGVPFVWTNASAGQFAGQQGVQDASLFLKYRFLKTEGRAGTFRAFVTGGVSAPVSNYIPDMLPFSIGLQSKTASLRGILHYKIGGVYLTAHAGYVARSRIRIDRDAYLFHQQIIESREVPVSNVVDASARLGYLNKHLQIEAYLDRMNSLSGDDIRRQDMPFPTNQMDQTTAGAMAKVHVYTKSGAFFSLVGQVGQVLEGRNVGKARMYTVGVQHTFRVGQ